MLRWIVLAVVVIALTAGATFLSVYAPDSSETVAVPAVVTTTGPQPKVEVPGPLVHEFGTMPQLTTAQHTWEFKNLGNADLELWFLSSTCSCTVAKLKSANGEEQKKLVVKPGDATTIDLEWQTKMFHDDYSKGATIGTNDPRRPSVSISVHGKVHPPVMVYPDESIVFNQISNDEAVTGRIAVFSMDRPDLKIVKMTTSRPDYLVAESRPLKPEECTQLKVKGGYQVSVVVKPGMPLGRFRDELVIETNHPLKQEVKATITGNVTGPISIIPERVRMASVSSGKGGSRDMTLLVRGGTPTKFTVAHHPDKVQVAIKSDDTPTQKGRYKMTVSVPPGTSAGPVDGEIILKTDHPKAAEMKIPVSILISNSNAG
jgi:hypothetical protein